PVNTGPDISTAAAAALAHLPVGDVRRVLAGLARAHLIEPAPPAANRWRMHDLLRLYARQLSDSNADADGRDLALDRLFDYYISGANAANAHLSTIDTATPGNFSSPDDALIWLDAERANLVAATKMAAASQRHEVAYRLPVTLGDYFAWK